MVVTISCRIATTTVATSSTLLARSLSSGASCSSGLSAKRNSSTWELISSSLSNAHSNSSPVRSRKARRRAILRRRACRLHTRGSSSYILGAQFVELRINLGGIQFWVWSNAVAP